MDLHEDGRLMKDKLRLPVKFSLVFASYSILADKDDNLDTDSLEVTTVESGTAVTYNDSDYSITIEDPLSTEEGLPWIITAIHEGIFEIYQAP